MNAVLRLTARRAAAGAAALAIAAGGLATAGPAAAADPPLGTVLSSTTATLPPELTSLATGKRLSYVSTGVTGARVTVTGLVLTPKRKPAHKTVVWGHGSTGLADQCAPSDSLAVFWPEARTAVAALLGRGWTVAAPDYEGLGSPGPHPYFVGGSEGRAMIDSVRAARSLDSSLSTQYAVDGHSQGGQGSLFAGELAPGYDGDLVLRGVAAIAPVSNVDILAPQIPGTPGQGYMVMALYGLAAVQPGFDPLTVLAPPARDRVSVLQSGCLLEILAAYQSLHAAQLVQGGSLPPSVVAQLAHYDNPAQVAPSAPILIVQGGLDQSVPAEVTDYLVTQLRAYDPNVVTYVQLPDETHDSAVVKSATTVADWIAARFAA